MVPNFKVTKNVIRVHKRDGGSGPGIDWHQAGLKSVSCERFLRGVILTYFVEFLKVHLEICDLCFGHKCSQGHKVEPQSTQLHPRQVFCCLKPF